MLLVVATLVLTGCGAKEAPPKPSSAPTPTAESTGVKEVAADAETQPTRHSSDSVDDPAIWVNHKDPAASLVLGNDKQGALETYNLDGSLVQHIVSPSTFWGNVDVRQGVPLASGPTDVVAAANGGVRLYALNPDTRKLASLTVGGVPVDTGGGEGVCLYDNPEGGLSVFMVFISGHVRQLALEDDGTGHLTADTVREFDVGSEAEGCVVDDESHALYLSEENVGLWKYDADPDGGDQRVMIDEVKPKGHQTPDIEGVTLVDDGNGRGLVIASSQAPAGVSSYFAVFDRERGDYRSAFRIGNGQKADGCSHTDGVAATAESLGPDFPEGLFVCQDDDNTTPGSAGKQDFKLTRLEKVRP